MEGRAAAPAAGTVLNALANGYGSAFAIDAHTEATVVLDDTGELTGEVADEPDADTRLVERCVERCVERFGEGDGDGNGEGDSEGEAAGGHVRTDREGVAVGGHVRTDSEVPMASGLKSSSAAANATVLATLDALGRAEAVDRLDACRLGVEVAREVGVTVTGAFDDASASMLGGVTVTDNAADELVRRDEPDWEVLVHTPDEQALSADADVDRCERVAPLADVAYELAAESDYQRAMCVNGFAFCAALGYPAEPLVEALPQAAASLSGTGPSYVAVGERDALEVLAETWDEREGYTWLTTTQTTGAMTQ